MAEDGFPLPGSSFKELCKIIAAYSETTGSSSPADVSKLIGIHETQVSRSNKFLLAIGVIDGGQKKKCTPLGAKIGRAIHFGEAGPTIEGWREIYHSTDFLQKIVSSIRIRKGMDESALISHIAFTSGNPKNASAMAGAGAVIEILKEAGAIEENGGTLVASDRPIDVTQSAIVGLANTHTEKEVSQPKRELVTASEENSQECSQKSFSSLRINLTISCTTEQLEGLGYKLRKLQQEFEGAADIDIKLKTEGAEDAGAEPASDS